MKKYFISVITIVNSFFVINLKLCVQTYEFIQKIMPFDYILELL